MSIYHQPIDNLPMHNSQNTTFVILDQDLSAKDSSHLLGRLVKNVRRPLDSYLPARTSPLPFLSTYVLDAKLEPNTSINLSYLKTTSTTTRLASLLGLSIANEADSRTSFTLSSKVCRTVALEQHELVFAELMQHHGQEIHAALRQSGRALYLVVGMKTALKPLIVRTRESNAGVTVGAKIEVRVNGAGAMSMEMGTTQKRSYNTLLEAVVDGERTFALQYYPVRLKSKVRLARGGEARGLMGVKRVEKPRLYGNGSQAFKGCLTYGPNSNDGDDEDEDEDEDDEMEIYLGSVMPIDDLDSLPY